MFNRAWTTTNSYALQIKPLSSDKSVVVTWELATAICLDKIVFKSFMIRLEVSGPSGPQLLVGGSSGQLDFVLRALRALRPRLTHQMAEILSRTNQRTRRF